MIRPPECPSCGRPAERGERQARYRRGTRVAAVTVSHWECPTGCIGPDGRAPYRFEDLALLRENDEAARTAWLEQFGESMPPARRPGRKPVTKRAVKLPIMLTLEEQQVLDHLRGTLSRSEFVRRRAFSSGKSSKAPRFPLIDTSTPDGPHREAQ